MASVFISHSSHDKHLLAGPLYHALTARGFQVWYDQASIDHGTSIPLEISEGLAVSNIFVIIVSSSYNASDWCRLELGAIIANCIGTNKRMFVIRVDDAPIENLISHLRYLPVSTSALKDKAAHDEFQRSVAERLTTLKRGRLPSTRPTPTAESLVATILAAERSNRFGQHLIESIDAPRVEHSDTAGRAEGLILIKPGGTFFEPCLNEVFRRILSRCDVVQLRVFDGETVRRRHLFRQQYVSNTKLAMGEISLNDEERARIRFIYDTPEFERYFGMKYSDDLLTPALQLESEPFNLSPEEISERWEQGRAEDLFWNGKWNGLNKIGYQKTVFPISIVHGGKKDVRLVLNGFIPGFKRLFEAEEARTIAVHVQTSAPWREIREQLVGGESDPRACSEGSIRRDAYDRRLPIDPRDPLVNGQRNVCHSSATLVDGLREIVAWFEYRPTQTILGSVLSLVGRSERDIEQTLHRYLEDLSWTTRDDTFAELFYEVRQGQVFDNLKGAQPHRDRAVQQFAAETGADPALVRRADSARASVETRVRWVVGGSEYFLFTIAKALFQGSRFRTTFYQTAQEIAELHARRWGRDRQEVLADAIRIAANDLRLLDSPVYKRRLKSGELFTAEVLADLPEQALACSERTRQNLVRDLAALVEGEQGLAPSLRIGETNDWAEYLTMAEAGKSGVGPNGPTALILAGGRSTRMYSTIPKPAFPFGRGLLLDSVVIPIRTALGKSSPVVAATGFRARLVQRALGDTIDGERVSYLTYPKTLGLAFRVATALHELARTGGDNELVLLTYTDIPGLPGTSILELFERVQDRDAFGMLVCVGADLSGHVEERHGKVTRVIQQRLHPGLCKPGMKRDVGLYIFRNTPHMRNAVLSITNDNLRGEYIFADVVERLASQGCEIDIVRIDAERCQSVNTVPELLLAQATPFIRRGDMAGLRRNMIETTGLPLPTPLPIDVFRAAATSHNGPLYFFPWWESTWLNKQ